MLAELSLGCGGNGDDGCGGERCGGGCRCSVGVKGDVGRVMGVVATGMMGVRVSGLGWVQVLCGCERGCWQSYGCGGNGDYGCGGEWCGVGAGALWVSKGMLAELWMWWQRG